MRRLHFKNADYFLAIVNEQSVSRAAEKLYISQPSLSKYLKRLEENLGVELFRRDSYPMSLTAAGELYYQYIMDIMEKERKLKQDFVDLDATPSGTVSMGITVWRSSIILPLVLPSFQQLYPRITVEVQEGSHKHLASLQEAGKVDFSVFHLPNIYSGLTFEHLIYERILFVVNAGNPVLQEVEVPPPGTVGKLSRAAFSHFKRQRFILLKPGQNIRDLTQNFLNVLQIQPDVSLVTSNIVTALNMVLAGGGVTFVPEAALQMEGYVDKLCYFEIDDPPVQWEVGFAYRTGESVSKTARLFMEYIKSRYVQVSEQHWGGAE